MIKGMNISVIGGGIAGMAAALACAQRGARVTLFEQADALAEVGAGLQISPNAVAVLSALGLRESAADKASAPDSIELRDLRSARRIWNIPMGETAVSRWGHPYWQFHRADLLAVLEHGARAAGVDIRLGQAVTDPGGDIVIAADGVRSPTRQRLFGGQVRFANQVAWRGIVKLDEPAHFPTQIWMGPGRHLVTYPLRGGTQVNFVAVEERETWTEEGWNIPADPDDLRAAFAHAAQPIRELLDMVTDTFLWGLFAHPPLDHWVSGNTVLIGDAAHPMTPFMAQGAGMGLEDAWVLADCLAAEGIAGLATFEAKRKARATRVQQTAQRNAAIYHMAGVPRPFLHLGMFGSAKLVPNLPLRMFDWIYGEDVTTKR